MQKEIYVVFWEGRNCSYIDGHCFITRFLAEEYAWRNLKEINPKYTQFRINQLELQNN